MTAIVGLEYDGGVVIGGDAAITWPYHLRVESVEPKVWQVGEWVLGTCGSCRIGDLLRHALTPPHPPIDDADIDKFLRTQFADAVRDVLVDSGTVYSKNALEEMSESDFLFGLRGKLYSMQADFSIIRSAGGYFATGCGMDLAMGAMHATAGLKPTTRIKRALEAAAAHNAAVMAPFTIIDVPA